ncbi:2-succinyl-5-enolpyruvyl-6-hydroxy-3-cyclohexene-1-carboxylic-acid synthase [Actinomadura rupiterrae]|uniref:2-succinyl-5-enolpyruvyl-6-hydroxy-3- cyclohexene-1-carboxylic-acid synthase n=1 Tax=Actinomadura rupiterrae TaxID=559627 RepID=UPI0020A5284D|nr:2-succinyl-5-enolpyruvyl-6-hydroxy-3-cyclohexene-1-carboxylic-acid synthase [Actinomadura rupiterrae]MCP2342070.1 2-succinyl-5-enolpyruvyl-6-hydroxy-3-cyclohexene-1-carboxylate synthase [Actinomadura rupiterrae]
MNPSSAQADVVVDELIRNGVRHVVLCAGGYTIPLAIALYKAHKEGRVQLHVRIDERSAGFLAVGLGRSGEGPVVLLCTPGTAVANFYPAVLEAHHSALGLILLTVDLLPQYRGTGASQSIDQQAVFGAAATTMEFPVAEPRAGQNAIWRGLVCRAAAQAATGRSVQINISFRELLPTADESWSAELEGRPDGRPWTTWTPPTRPAGGFGEAVPARTLMVIGSGDPARARAAAEVAAQAGWPVIAEPIAAPDALRAGATVLRGGMMLAVGGELSTSPRTFPPHLRPDAIVVVGRTTLARDVPDGLTGATVYRVDDQAHWTDPYHNATHSGTWLDPADPGQYAAPDPAWLAGWQRFDDAVAATLDKHIDEAGWPAGLYVARKLVAALPKDANLFLGASNSVRDVGRFAAARADLAVHANRGVSGIDGNISTAAGLALGRSGRGRPNYALMGDLTFLHDVNGLLLGPDEPRPDLTIVVVNNRGGGVYSLLVRHESPEDAAGIERIFGTPHSVDVAGLCASHDVAYQRISDLDDLDLALAPAGGIRVVEVETADRSRLLDIHRRIHTSINDLLSIAD